MIAWTGCSRRPSVRRVLLLPSMLWSMVVEALLLAVVGVAGDLQTTPATDIDDVLRLLCLWRTIVPTVGTVAAIVGRKEVEFLFSLEG